MKQINNSKLRYQGNSQRIAHFPNLEGCGRSGLGNGLVLTHTLILDDFLYNRTARRLAALEAAVPTPTGML